MTTSDNTIVLPSESEDGYAHFKWSSEAWYIRLYLWLYGARKDKINTCKLFWAYVFAIVVLPFRLVGAFVKVVLEGLDARLPERKKESWEQLEARLAREEAARKAKVEKGPGRAERFLEAFAAKASAVYLKVAPALKWIGIVLGAILGLVLAYLLVTVAINHTADFLRFVLTLGAVVILGTLVLLVIVWAENRESARTGTPSFFTAIGKLAKGFHTHTCAKIDLD